MSTTEFAYFIVTLVVLSVWIPIMVWVSVQVAVYAYFFAKRRFTARFQTGEFFHARQQGKGEG